MNLDCTDKQLVTCALDGDRNAMEQLIIRHEKFVYNLAVRMLWNRDDAADAVQEIFLRVVTHLSSFRMDSEFRTWMYRIACNHLLQCRRRSRAEQGIRSFECYAQCLSDMPDEANDSPEAGALINEVGIGCLLGMLLCLSREQRIVYILGEIFEMSDGVGAAVLAVTKENFRQRLSRSRQQLHQFLRGNCGLVNPENTCRCKGKLKGFVAAGIVDSERLQFADEAFHGAHAIATLRRDDFAALIQNGPGAVYRHHPTWRGPDIVEILRQLISDERMSEILLLNGPVELSTSGR